jgi:hypothetical protein
VQAIACHLYKEVYFEKIMARVRAGSSKLIPDSTSESGHRI